MTRRLLVIAFTRLASDLWLRKRPVAGPFALIARAGNSDRLHCVNSAAAGLGLHRGMPLADARAVFPDLSTAPADPALEAEGLRRLRRWMLRYAPLVGLEGGEGLVADITGAAHLLGGEATLREDVQARLERAGFDARTAIAPTRGAAWALARHGGGVIAEGRVEQALAPLPLAALRLSDDLLESLARMGLNRIRDLMDQPRAPMARRFGPQPAQRLDQALGLLPEPIATFAEAPHFGVRISLPEPIGLTADVMAGLDRLLERLCAKLEQAQMGARRLRLDLQRVDHETLHIDIGLARPMRDPARISALFLRHVEEADSGFGIEALRLEAHVVEPLAPEQIGNQAAKAEDDLADLISQLGNRLGFGAVIRAHPVESRLPEHSFVKVPAAYRPPSLWPARSGPKRPVIFFAPEQLVSVSGHPPVSFRWRRMAFHTWRAHGPERITPDWWEDDPAWGLGMRDYWRVETREGPRLWLFHTPQSPGWSVQGEFL